MNDNLELNDMLPQKEIIKYIPINGIQNVLSLSDFLADGNAKNINNTDCINIARLVIDNGHMGVICKIKENFVKKRTQHQKLVNINEETDITEIFVDIESFTHDTGDLNKSQIPYLICWSYNSNNEVFQENGKNCIEHFFTKILSNFQNEKNIILYMEILADMVYNMNISCCSKI